MKVTQNYCLQVSFGAPTAKQSCVGCNHLLQQTADRSCRKQQQQHLRSLPHRHACCSSSSSSSSSTHQKLKAEEMVEGLEQTRA